MLLSLCLLDLVHAVVITGTDLSLFALTGAAVHVHCTCASIQCMQKGLEQLQLARKIDIHCKYSVHVYKQ